MRDNFLLVLLAVPVSLALWLGMYLYVNNTAEPDYRLPPPNSDSEQSAAILNDETASSQTPQQRADPDSEAESPESSQNTKQAEQDNNIQQQSPSNQQAEQPEDSESDSESQIADAESTTSDKQADATQSDTDSKNPATEDARSQPAEKIRDDRDNSRTILDQIKIGDEHGVTVIGIYSDPKCAERASAAEAIHVLFRVDSAVVRSESLSALDTFITEYNNCSNQQVLVALSEKSKRAALSIQRRRLDEVKYHLLHRGIDKSHIALPDNL